MEEPSEGVGLFIASVGERDPESDSGPTGPLRGARELRPRAVVLVAAPGVEAQAERTRERIARELPGASVTVERLDVADPTHLDALLPACGRLLDRALAEFPGNGNVAVCASSGTPQIGLALTLAALAKAPGAQHFQALNPAKADQPWRPFDPDALRHHAELDAALWMLAGCRFEEAAGLLERRLQSAATEARAHRPAIAAARAVAAGLDRANALDPSGAYRELQQSPKPPSIGAAGLNALREWYAQVKSAPRKQPAWPAELAARAAREATAGRVPQALVAAAIAFEVALAVRARTTLGLDFDRLSASDLAKLPRSVAKEARQFGPGVFRLEGAQRRSEALAAVDPAYARWHKDGRRDALLNRRNHLVHAAKAPTQGAADQALSFLDEMFGALDWPVPSACPSAPKSIAALVAALRPAAGLQ